jgi:hypothetical protein
VRDSLRLVGHLLGEAWFPMLQLPSLDLLEALAARGGHGDLRAFNEEEAAKITAIPRCVRLAYPSARAAFAVVQWRKVEQAPDNVPCTLCSTLTSDFCGACHFCNAPANPAPLPVCRTCDGELRVCRLCTGAGWTHEAAERQFRRQFPRAAMGQTMVLYGVQSPEGFKRLDKPKEADFPAGAVRH